VAIPASGRMPLAARCIDLQNVRML